MEKHRLDYEEQENGTSLEYEMFEVVWFFISLLHDGTFLNRNETLLQDLGIEKGFKTRNISWLHRS